MLLSLLLVSGLVSPETLGLRPNISELRERFLLVEKDAAVGEVIEALGGHGPSIAVIRLGGGTAKVEVYVNADSRLPATGSTESLHDSTIRPSDLRVSNEVPRAQFLLSWSEGFPWLLAFLDGIRQSLGEGSAQGVLSSPLNAWANGRPKLTVRAYDSSGWVLLTPDSNWDN